MSAEPPQGSSRFAAEREPGDESAEVVIPHTAGPERLEAVLSDLRAQSAGHQVCVVDNAAPAESGEVARAAGARVVEMGANAGFGRAVNEAVRTSDAGVVVFLNDDCRPEPGFVGEILGVIDESGAAMVAAVLLRPDGRIDSAGVEADTSLIAFDYLHGAAYDPEVPPPAPPLGPTGGAAGFDRGAFLDAGGYDERFFAYLEDVDLALRMRAAGHECVLAWRAVAVHHHSATLGSGSAAKNRLMGESRGRLAAKWRPALPVGARVRGLALDGVTYAGKAVVDRNLGAVRGRMAVRGEERQVVAADALEGIPLADVSVREALRRRLARRR